MYRFVPKILHDQVHSPCCPKFSAKSGDFKSCEACQSIRSEMANFLHSTENLELVRGSIEGVHSPVVVHFVVALVSQILNGVSCLDLQSSCTDE
jgi:hypothetical protein